MMEPQLLLIDEPSIGLDPRSVEALFGALRDLQTREGKSILMVEQNVREGLAFADVGCLLLAGRVVAVGPGPELLADTRLGEFFLGD
jgi:branched-chain amino acid transport system ATP-binding protein